MRATLRRREPLVFAWTLVVPRTKRRHVQAILSFFFALDDIVDSPQVAPSLRREQLELQHEKLRTALAARRSDDVHLDLVVHGLQALRLPSDLFEAQFRALAGELDGSPPESFADWCAMFEPSAAIFASVAMSVQDVESPDAWTALRELGVGLNLVDVICDLPDDLREGRVLLPREDLERFGVDPRVTSPTREWSELVRFEVTRGRTLLEAGSRVFTLPGLARPWALRVGVEVFTERLDAIERRGYDVFAPRSSLAPARELAVGFRSIVVGLVGRFR